MIPANELRIGNWIRDKEVGYKDDFQVRAADIVTIALGKIDYHPIPLTPEILIACGFEFNYHFKSYQIKEFNCEIYPNPESNYSVSFMDVFDENEVSKEVCTVKHLHQLQNLYFALTGTELEYKPTT